MLQVVAGVIEKDERVLLCQRHRDSRRFPLKWEFPGGKVEKNETPKNAIIRELKEELGIRVIKLEQVEEYFFAYPDEAQFHLYFYRILEHVGEPENLQFETMEWVSKEKIKDHDLLEGDLPFIKNI